MKKIITTLVALSLSAVSLSAMTDAEKAAKARSLYQQGTIAIREGNYDIARMSFREVLKLYPKHSQARRQLHYIHTNQSSLELAKRKKSLSGVVLPKVVLDGATVSESIQLLSTLIKQNSKKKASPNFIVQDPQGVFKSRKVNLTLNNIPADAVLKYIAGQSRALVRYDKHAIIITPRGTTAKKVTPKAPTKKKVEEDPDGF